MKKILLVTSCVLILSACTSNSSIDQAGPSTVTRTATQNTTDNMSAATEPIIISEADQSAYDNAISLSDKALCDKITNADLKKSCQIKIEALEKANAAKVQSEAALKTEYENYSKLIDSGEIGNCSKNLQDPNLVKNCEAGIITNEAVATKNPGKCDSIKDTVGKEDCRKALNALPQ